MSDTSRKKIVVEIDGIDQIQNLQEKVKQLNKEINNIKPDSANREFRSYLALLTNIERLEQQKARSATELARAEFAKQKAIDATSQAYFNAEKAVNQASRAEEALRTQQALTARTMQQTATAVAQSQASIALANQRAAAIAQQSANQTTTANTSAAAATALANQRIQSSINQTAATQVKAAAIAQQSANQTTTAQANIQLAHARTQAIQQNMANQLNKPAPNTMLVSLLKYKAVEMVFGGISKSIHDSIEAMIELDKQASRTSRIANPQDRGFYQGMIGEGGVRSGRSFKDSGEVSYQMATFIKDNTQLLKAYREQMDLLVGTEGDARDSTRLTIQIYEQFGDQMGKNIETGEKFHRINELIAGSFKDSHAELSELSNALKYLGPIAQAAKIPMEQVFAVVSALTTEGHRGRMAGTEVGQFISQLIKNGDSPIYSEAANGKLERLNYLSRTPAGGVDLMQTLKNISDIANKMPTDKAEKFLMTIGGTQNAFRFMGSQTEETRQLLTQFYDNATKRSQGLTQEIQALKGEMDKTFEVQGLRAWNATLLDGARVLGAIAEKLGIIKGLKGFADAVDDSNRTQNDNALIGQRLGQIPPAENTAYMRGVAQRYLAYRKMNGATMENFIKQGVHNDGAIKLYNPNTGEYYRPYSSPASPLNDNLSQQDWRRLEEARLYENEAKALGGALKRDLGVGYIDDANVQRWLKATKTPLSSTGFPNMGRGMAGVPPAAVTFDRKTGNFITQAQLDKRHNEQEAANREAESASNRARRNKIDQITAEMNIVTTQTNEGARAANTPAKYDKWLPTGMALNKRYNQLSRQKGILENDTAGLYQIDKGILLRDANQSLLDQKTTLTEKTNDAREKKRDVWTTQKEQMADYFDAMIEHEVRNGYRTPYASMLGGWADTLRMGQLSRADQYRYRAGLKGSSALVSALPNAPSLFADNYAAEFVTGMGSLARRNMAGYGMGIRGIESGYRPNGLYGAPADEMAYLQGQRALTASTIQKGGLSSADLKTLNDELFRFDEAIRNLKDTLATRDYERSIRRIGERESEGLFGIEMSSNPLQSLGRNGAYNQQVSMAVRRRDVLQSTLTARTFAYMQSVGMGMKDDIKEQRGAELTEASRNLARASKELSDLPRQRYAGIYSEVQGQVNGSLVNVLRGRQDGLGAVKGVGDMLIDKTLENLVEKWTSPFITTITDEIAAMQNLTQVMDSVPSRMGAVMSGKSDTKVGKAGGGGSRSMGGKSGIAMGLGGFSMLMGGVQNGNDNLGSMVGNYLGGEALFGGLLGATAGGFLGLGLGLIGGLFHKKKVDPMENYKNTSYALTNSPDDMIYQAYRYRVTGQYPTRAELGLPAAGNTPVPIVNVYVDGVKSTVTRAVNQMTNSQNVQLSNLNYPKAPF